MSTGMEVYPGIEVRGILPTEHGGPYDIRTYGLGPECGHCEFQVLTPGYAAFAMREVLTNFVLRIVETGHCYKAGDDVLIGGVMCGLRLVEIEDEPMRLRIIDLPGGGQCECCGCRSADGSEGIATDG